MLLATDTKSESFHKPFESYSQISTARKGVLLDTQLCHEDQSQGMAVAAVRNIE